MFSFHLSAMHRLFFTLALVVSGLGSVSAQPYDGYVDVVTGDPLSQQPQGQSFFDIFIESPVDKAACPLCLSLKEEIDAVEAQIAENYRVSDDLRDRLKTETAAVMDLERRIADLNERAEELRNPKSFVESDGRRFDGSDHAALARRNANLWRAYKGGRMTAQEYSDEIAKPFDDPQVAEDLKLIKEIILMEIADALETANRDLTAAQGRRDDLTARIGDLAADIKSLEAESAALREDLEGCEILCKDDQIPIPDDLSIMPENRGIFDVILDFFAGLFEGEDEIFPYEREALKEAEEMIDDRDFSEEPSRLELDPELVKKIGGLLSMPVVTVIPPVRCHLCDPLRAELAELQAELDFAKLRMEDRNAVEKTFRDAWNDALSLRDAARRALDRFDNPSASGESDGRSLDSNDQAAMRERNGRLWRDYKDGKISASDLEAEWAKSYDDPAVRRELDAIKDRMRDELQDALDDAEAAMKDISDALNEVADAKIDLSGRIAAMEVIVKHLQDQIAACEKRCVEQADVAELSVDTTGYEAFIFPETEFETSSSSSVDDEDVEESERGFIEWFIDFFGGDDEEETVDDFDDASSVSSRSSAVSESSSSQDDDDDSERDDADEDPEADDDAQDDAFSSSSESRKSSSSQKSSAASECDPGTMTESACKKSCDGTCYESYEEFDGLRCFTCKQAVEKPKEQCDPPTETEAECKRDCFGTCDRAYTRNDGVKCFECMAESSSSSSKKSSSSSSVEEDDGPSCVGGTVADKSQCESQCSAKGGTCTETNGCYSCVILNCPDGTYKNECPSSCSAGCDTVGEQSGVKCYQCKQDCKDVCTRNGFDPAGTDYTAEVLSTLNGYTCVSGASVSVTTATIGSCSCTASPKVTVDQTAPVCAGTTCGDVACGQTATCSPSPDTTATVRCNWGGWRDLGNLRFQPIIGQ